MWFVFILLYLVSNTIFTQFYKIATRTSVRNGALTVLLQLIAGGSILLLCPLFQFKFPENPGIYLVLGAAVIFYAISDRINTTVRSGIEASTFNVIQQLSTVFMIFFGFFFFKEPFKIAKAAGAALIIFSNALVFYKKGSGRPNKFIMLGVLSSLAFTMGLFFDVNISNLFNLPFYVSLSLLCPALLIFVFERVKCSWIREELTQGNKRAVLISGFAWGATILCQLRAYQLGEVTSVAPLCALAVIVNVAVSYFFLGEKDRLPTKLIAAVLILISVVLIRQ